MAGRVIIHVLSPTSSAAQLCIVIYTPSRLLTLPEEKPDRGPLKAERVSQRVFEVALVVFRYRCRKIGEKDKGWRGSPCLIHVKDLELLLSDIGEAQSLKIGLEGFVQFGR